MASTRVTLKALKFEAKLWTKEFERKMKNQNRIGAGEWLRAVLTHVPVLTGMAQASLLPLARYLAIRHAGEMFDIFPIQYPDRINLGQESAVDPESLFYSDGRGGFSFQYDITVLHFLLNEFEFHGTGTPWRAMDMGKIAYENYININVPTSVPRVTDFIVKVNIENADMSSWYDYLNGESSNG